MVDTIMNVTGKKKVLYAPFSFSDENCKLKQHEQSNTARGKPDIDGSEDGKTTTIHSNAFGKHCATMVMEDKMDLFCWLYMEGG